MLGVVAATLVLVAGIALLARAQSARGAAQAAADLGALAAAEQLAAASRGGAPSGTQIPVGPALAARACGLASEVVRANGANLTECDLVGHGVVRVRAMATAGARTATASAQAGPAPVQRAGRPPVSP